MIREATAKLMNHQDLTQEETCTVIDEMMDGKTTPVQTAAFLTALQCKKATVTEILACATSMRNHATPLDAGQGLLEIVGTGGDHSNSFNISTTSSFVCAAGGCRVAKHGNRAASSRSGCTGSLGRTPGCRTGRMLAAYEPRRLLFPLCPDLSQGHEARRPCTQGNGPGDGL